MSEMGLDSIYAPSDNVVAREVEGEVIIVPLVAGLADLEDELFTLNDTGKAVWHRLDGKTPLRSVIQSLETEYDANPGEIASDVLGLIDELCRRKIVVGVSGT